MGLAGSGLAVGEDARVHPVRGRQRKRLHLNASPEMAGDEMRQYTQRTSGVTTAVVSHVNYIHLLPSMIWRIHAVNSLGR